MYIPGQMQQSPVAVSSAPTTTPPVAPGAFTAQAGYNGAVGNSLTPLVSAMMKAKLAQKLKGQLPGTTPQSIGLGTAGSDAATAAGPPPPSFGGPDIGLA